MSIPARLCLFALMPLAALVATGCASRPTPNRAPQIARAPMEPGYRPTQRYALRHFESEWPIAGQATRIAFVGPDTGESVPLVIYLPGLGESASAAQSLREAWAEAGYAVLAAQPDAQGPAVLESEAFRSGDFRYLGRAQLAPPAMQQRVQWARALLAEIRRRTDAHDPSLGRCDLRQTAMAGFEIGAQTAMALAGEGAEAPPATEGRIPLRAVIAISPFVDFSGPSFEQRFAAITAPVLSITGSDDDDPWGVVPSAALRHLPFERMPPGRKWLLSLADTTHAMLSDSTRRFAPLPANGTAAEATPEKTAPSERGNRGRQEGGSSQRRGARRGTEADLAGIEAVQRPEALQRRLATLSVAFLDTSVREAPEAAHWMRAAASRWLGEGGDLLAKP